jgi:hypothetical protein
VSLLTRYRPDWWEDAICRNEGIGPDLFFEPSYAVIRVCRRCPVRLECLASGVDERYGVWGGFMPGERRRIRSLLNAGASLSEATDRMDQWRDQRGR